MSPFNFDGTHGANGCWLDGRLLILDDRRIVQVALGTRVGFTGLEASAVSIEVDGIESHLANLASSPIARHRERSIC
jgi:hypothetical protein